MIPEEQARASAKYGAARNWLRAIRLYLGATLVGHLVWEVLQLPLYTISRTGSPGELAFAVAHCTSGDMLIALSSLMGALILTGSRQWPAAAFARVAALAILLGVVYTGFSEWWNVSVRASWAYSEHMPIVSVLGARLGLSPLLQWVVIPAAAFATTRRITKPESQPGGRA